MNDLFPAPAPSGDVDPPASAAGRVLLAGAVGLLALVLVLAARADRQTPDARLGRRVELVELITFEQARNEAMAAEVEQLSARVAAFERGEAAGGDALKALQSQLDEIAAPAGMTGLAGHGISIVLTDSALAESPSGDLNDLVIHEQDLQAVINALWAGGAEAVGVNSQRVVATTAIRCVGNTLLLHGRVYSPPYVIEAVGDAVALRDALQRDPAVERLTRAVQQFQVGFTVADAADLRLPPYEGSAALQSARPAEATG